MKEKKGKSLMAYAHMKDETWAAGIWPADVECGKHRLAAVMHIHGSA